MLIIIHVIENPSHMPNNPIPWLNASHKANGRPIK